MENPETLHDKLVAIQSGLVAPKNQYNNFGKYSYRSTEDIVESVKPLLDIYSVTLVQNDEIVLIGTRTYIKATVTISDGTDSISNTAYAREPEIQKGMNESQITGSASSYARKYALNGLFAIDDTKDSDHNSQNDSYVPLIQIEQINTLKQIISAKNLNIENVCMNWNIKSLSELQTRTFNDFKKWLENEPDLNANNT